MGFLKKYIKHYWKPFWGAIVCLTLEALCDLMQPTIMSKIVDVGISNKDISYVTNMGGIMLLITLAGAIAATGRNILAGSVSQKFGRDLRSDLYRKVHTFSFDNIDKFETASLVTRLTNDVTQVQNFANGLMRIFVKAPILCIGSIIMAVRLNIGMAMVLVIVVPVVGMLIFINLKVGYPYFVKVQKVLDKVNGVIREYLSGVRVVKAFNRFSYETSRFEKSNQEFGKVSMTAMRVMAVFSPGITLTVNFGITAVLWFGSFSVGSGEMQVGQIIAFVNYMTQILFSLMMISFVFNMFVRAQASAERIGEVFSQQNIMSASEHPILETENTGAVEFDHVYFSYSNASLEPMLKDITFSCRPGETIGIIGSTGSGKSTLVNLIPRFYDPSSGTVKVDGVDVREMDMKMLREKIAMVPQKSVLFSGTVMDNIRWGREDASFDEVKAAAEISQADLFLSSFPEGYDTRLGQGGVNLSGGQKQRVSIARALVKKPEILILDDSTSAVDMATEAKIREGLKSYLKGLTCIIIAQRITSVMGADRILVMDNGEITGAGTHEELLKTCDIYQDIYRSQMGKEAVENGRAKQEE